MLKNFFTNLSMNSCEATRLELLAVFSIKMLNINPGRVHIFLDVLYRATLFMKESILLKNMSVFKEKIPLRFTKEYEHEKYFGPVITGLRGELKEGKEHKCQVAHFLPIFSFEDLKLHYVRKRCISCSCLKEAI